MSKAVWINNSRVGRRLAEMLGNQAEKLAFAISKLISVTVPIGDLIWQEIPISIAAVAGNVITYITPARGSALRLNFGKVYLDTDATVADRYIELEIYDAAGTLVAGLGLSSTAVTANNLRAFYWSKGSWMTGGLDCYLAGSDLVVRFPYKIGIRIGNGVAGDAYDILCNMEFS